MAYQFKGDCAWCGSVAVSFTPIDQRRWNKIEGGKGFVHTDMFATCGRCDRASLVVFKGDYNSSISAITKAIPKQICPASPPLDAPPFTPDRCRDYFKQGMAALRYEAPDAAGAMFRKALESGLTERFSSSERNLIDKIKDAAAQHFITTEMADWADHIRVSGNEAVHGDDFTMEEAKELRVFTELVLIYLFELPGRLASAQQRRPATPGT